VRRIVRWLDAMPPVSLAVEVGPDRVAAARWGRTGSLDGYAVEMLPPGALVPSAVEANIVNGAAVKAAVADVCGRLNSRDEDVAMILPDTVIRVFVQHFEELPRSAWTSSLRLPGSASSGSTNPSLRASGCIQA
jgi:hypothetical protein